MLKAKSSENFQSPDQNWENFGGFVCLRVRSFKKLRFVPEKVRPCVNPRRSSHFALNQSSCVTSSLVGEKPIK